MKSNNNFVSYIMDSAKAHPDVVALRNDHLNPPYVLTYGDMCAATDKIARAFLKLGMKSGSRVALFADNQPLWKLTDYALLSIGAVSIPRGTDSAIAELWYILQHSDASIAILQNADLAIRLFEAGHADNLENIIIFAATKDEETLQKLHQYNYKIHFMDDLMAEAVDETINMDEVRESVKPDQMASIVYTSGTTGMPKGVILTHASLTSQLYSVDVGLLAFPAGLLQLAMLPAWHMYERMAEYFVTFQICSTIVYTDKRHLKHDIFQLAPSIIPCVPRIWEMVFDNIRNTIKKQSLFKQSLFRFFVSNGKVYIKAKRIITDTVLRKKAPGIFEKLMAGLLYLLLSPIQYLAKILIFERIRKQIASNLVAAVNGGGSISAYIDDFFEVIGVTFLNGYGLTETSPVIAVRSLSHNVRGSVGRPIKNCEVEIRNEEFKPLPQGETGQIWVKGPQVMKGYYKNETETQKVMRDGWLNTGDIGWITYTGDLVISGRAKDTIVLQSGENIEPEPIEGMLRECQYIQDLVVLGQDRKFLSALIIPNAERIIEALGLAKDTSLQDLANRNDANKLVKDEIVTLMQNHGGFKENEIISRITLLVEPFSVENGLLTQTLKPKRNPINKRYADEIEKMYS